MLTPQTILQGRYRIIRQLGQGGMGAVSLTRAAALVNGEKDPSLPANEINPAVGPHTAAVLARGMSQNRERRYSSAAAMRAAFRDPEGATTNADRTEAATVLFPEATRADAAQPQAALPAGLTGETTVVQTSKPQRSRIAPWAIAAAAVILIGVGFGVFYAIQNRDNSAAVSSPSPQPSPTAEAENIDPNRQVDPATGGSTGDQAAEAADATLKKNEKVVKPKENAAERANVAEKPKPTPQRGRQYPTTADVPEMPETPLINSPDNTFNRQQPLLGPRIRTLPDGSQVIVNRDGTRVLIKPDGTRHVMPRIQPRRRRVP